MNEKIQSLLQSRRFWLGVIGTVMTVVQEFLPMSPEQVQVITHLFIGWIVGDSLHKTELKKT